MVSTEENITNPKLIQRKMKAFSAGLFKTRSSSTRDSMKGTELFKALKN